MSLLVEIEKQLGNFHLDVRFQAETETLALLGASGCGKSMTLKCIAGIMTPDRGRIVLNGRVLFDSEARIDLPPQQRRVGYLFQNYALFPTMTVEKNILCGIRSGSKAEKNAALTATLHRFRAVFRAGQLSEMGLGAEAVRFSGEFLRTDFMGVP